ncbi:SpoIIE family protein phosphatase, partial [Staphylococcus chromogenes]
GEFINQEKLLEFIKGYKQLHPQDIVQLLYEQLIRIHKEGKRDDLTILIIKRVN